jgi:uncharacterized protein YbbK (DUF523 family)
MQPRVGISSCLLGRRVRYDGGHRKAAALLRWRVRWVPVCPELEVGMGVPREPVRLVGARMVSRSGVDWTARMRAFARRRIAQLRRLNLAGFVLKAGSPSCGIERVKRYGPRGRPSLRGQGLFAAALLEAFPRLPIADEARLADPTARAEFLRRVKAYARRS